MQPGPDVCMFHQCLKTVIFHNFHVHVSTNLKQRCSHIDLMFYGYSILILESTLLNWCLLCCFSLMIMRYTAGLLSIAVELHLSIKSLSFSEAFHICNLFLFYFHIIIHIIYAKKLVGHDCLNAFCTRLILLCYIW